MKQLKYEGLLARTAAFVALLLKQPVDSRGRTLLFHSFGGARQTEHKHLFHSSPGAGALSLVFAPEPFFRSAKNVKIFRSRFRFHVRRRRSFREILKL